MAFRSDTVIFFHRSEENAAYKITYSSIERANGTRSK